MKVKEDFKEGGFLVKYWGKDNYVVVFYDDGMLVYYVYLKF